MFVVSFCWHWGCLLVNIVRHEQWMLQTNVVQIKMRSWSRTISIQDKTSLDQCSYSREYGSTLYIELPGKNRPPYSMYYNMCIHNTLGIPHSSEISWNIWNFPEILHWVTIKGIQMSLHASFISVIHLLQPCFIFWRLVLSLRSVTHPYTADGEVIQNSYCRISGRTLLYTSLQAKSSFSSWQWWWFLKIHKISENFLKYQDGWEIYTHGKCQCHSIFCH